MDASWKALAAAVPDEPEETVGGYREGAPSTALEPHSRKALDLAPASQRVKKAQEIVGLLAGPFTAAAFTLFPLEALGGFSPLVGAIWGLGTGASLLRDHRKALGAFALLLGPLFIVGMSAATFYSWPVFAIICALGVYGAARRVLDLKDLAGKEESDREVEADPRYQFASREGRARGLALSKGMGGGDSTGATARDNSTAT
jgi:hypothetical protein